MDQEKILQLSEAIYSRNIFYLKQAAIRSDGLVSNEIRKSAWALLLNISHEPWHRLDYSNSYSDLIQKDIDRSLFGMDISDTYTEVEREGKRQDLSNIINAVISLNPDLHYSQGYNQICTVFYITAGLDLGFYLSEKCAQDMLRDSMRKSFEDGLIQQLHLIYKLLESCDVFVARKLEAIYSFDAEVGIPSIAVPWIICWLSSSLYKYIDIAKVFDFCLATHALAPVYISVAIILAKRKELLESQETSDVHVLYREITDLHIGKICTEAFELMCKVSPMQLALMSKVKFLPK